MDIERYRQLLDDERRGQADLVTMRESALQQGALAHIAAAEAALDRRFSGWRTVRLRRGGAKPTDVEFLGRREHFASEKAAYVWLLERFIQHYPKPFVHLDWETVFVAKGPRALYFAKSLKRLFGKQGQHMAADATVSGLRFGVDWDWNGQGRNDPLESAAAELLEELERL